MKKTLIAIAAAAFAVVAIPAGATPVTNHFTAYDLTTTTGRPCDVQEKPYCDPVHQVTASSYFNAPMLAAQSLYHYPSNDMYLGVERYSVGPTAGQNAGVMCWLAPAAGGIWEKVDVRLTVQSYTGTGTALWIGYVPDSKVNLSYADRVNYVSHC